MYPAGLNRIKPGNGLSKSDRTSPGSWFNSQRLKSSSFVLRLVISLLNSLIFLNLKLPSRFVIIADDVKCSHGAFICDSEEYQLVYLQARATIAAKHPSSQVFYLMKPWSLTDITCPTMVIQTSYTNLHILIDKRKIYAFPTSVPLTRTATNKIIYPILPLPCNTKCKSYIKETTSTNR